MEKRGGSEHSAGPPRRRRIFFVLAALIPLLAFGALEGGLRLVNYGGDLRLFVRAPFQNGKYSRVNERFPARYFINVRYLPTPAHDLFLTKKPANGFRVFVLGESTAIGFPYGYNGTFSRVLLDALRDVLPHDSVEVVNLGFAAISSYALYDQVSEVLAQHPDAVLLYVGHNEYYGALGVGSTERAVGSPALIRAYLGLQRLKIFLLARNLAVAIARRVQGRSASAGDRLGVMELVAREKDIPLGGPVYRRGVAQFRDNLGAMLRRFREAGVPVFVGSLTSNLRDQAPFRPIRTGPAPAADSVYGAAQRALARGDTVEARRQFVLAQDLDGLRFRAPSAFNGVIRDVVRAYGAHYVPVEEAFAAASPGGIEGKGLFWEHVHPTQAGYVLMAKAYFEALRGAGFLGRAADTMRLRSWQAYSDRMELTEFDRQFAWHSVELLKHRWPFVERETPGGYPANYRPTDLADSAAFTAVYGDLKWRAAKTALAEEYLRGGQLALALAEYRGLMREEPLNPPLLLSAAGVYERMNDTVRARELVVRAYGIEQSEATSYALGSLELRAQRYASAIPLLEQALRSAPDNPSLLFDLSRAYILVRDLERARFYAERLAAVSPNFPGLAEWRAMLGSLRD
jgi:lysophospholipase L1-like esterase/Flp pilus assembly protein TadD